MICDRWSQINQQSLSVPAPPCCPCSSLLSLLVPSPPCSSLLWCSWSFGRRVLLTMCYLLMAVSGTCAAFSPSFSLFCLFRFMCGMALSGVGLNSFSLSKWISPREDTALQKDFRHGGSHQKDTCRNILAKDMTLLIWINTQEKHKNTQKLTLPKNVCKAPMHFVQHEELRVRNTGHQC